MTDLFLIAGFLGAGKTTFLKEFACLFERERLAVLVNEFGREGIDGQLLQELGSSVEEVHSGSIFCACRVEQFSAALTSLLEKKPSVILVEASGLSDPTTISSLLSTHPKADRINYKGCICIADCVRFEKTLATVMVCGKQLDICDMVILNKTDLASQSQIQRAKSIINNIRGNIPVYLTSYGKVKNEWVKSMKHLAISTPNLQPHIKDVSLNSRLIEIKDTFPREKFLSFLSIVVSGAYRIKGFVKLKEGNFLVDCVGEEIRVSPWDKDINQPNRLVALSGRGLSLSSALKEAMAIYSDYIILVD